MSDKVAMPKDG